MEPHGPFPLISEHPFAAAGLARSGEVWHDRSAKLHQQGTLGNFMGVAQRMRAQSRCHSQVGNDRRLVNGLKKEVRLS